MNCLLIFFFGLLLQITSASFIETGECSEKNVCTYFYSAQQYFDEDDTEQRYTQINATVEVTCLSMGQYNDSDAKLYCMDVKDVSIHSTLFEDSSMEEKSYARNSLIEHLSKWMCFIQSASGKIPAVYHDATDQDDAVGFKKSLTAAFQANLEGTSEEEETDSISKHTSHYTYQKPGDGRLRMNRTILEEDIKEYSTGSKSKNIESIIQEEIEYKNGKLEHSEGNIVIQMINRSNSLDVDEDEKEENFTLSGAFSARGHYFLQVQECRLLSANSLKSLRRVMGSKITHSVAEDLKVNSDSKVAAHETMKELRRKLPSGSVTAALLNYKTYNREKLEAILMELMELELRYNTLSTHRNALDDIVLFMDEEFYSSDREVRELVADLLMSQPSLKAQLALLSAFDHAVDEAEANALLIHLSFLESVDTQFIAHLEERLNETNSSQPMRDQLLLVYGSLAMKGNREVEYRVLDHLIDKVMAYQYGYCNTSMDIILMSLSNTGSKLSIQPILSFLNTSGYFDVDNMLKVISALSKVTDHESVLSKMEELVQAYPFINTASTIIETLDSGLEYVENSKLSRTDYLEKIKTHRLLSSLARIVSTSNASILFEMTNKYFIKINASEETFNLIHPSSSSLSRRKRYSSTNWTNSYSDFNHVASEGSRESDKKTYTRHIGYLNSKRLGISDAHLKIVSGFFAGTTTNCDSMKVYGRVSAIGKVLSYTRTAADAKFDLRLTTSSASLKAYVRIGSNYLLNVDERRSLSSHCWAKTKNVVQLKIQLFYFRFSIFVYISKLSFGIGLYFQFNLNLNSNICIGRTGTEISGALGAITPTAGLTLQGSASASLLSAVRGGITASATFNYRLEPAVSIQACTRNCGISERRCVGLYDSHPDNNINIHTWYQSRKVSMCGRWIRYPCIKWGRKHTWKSLTHTWSLGSSPRKSVWQRCSGKLDYQCAAGALSSPLFSY